MTKGYIIFTEEILDEEDDSLRECFQHCLQSLTTENRALIVEYYEGEQRTRIERRKQMAQRLGQTQDALRHHTKRIRERLEQCVNRCRKRKQWEAAEKAPPKK